MIDEVRTFEEFGYHTSDLSQCSTARIYAICEKCGKVRTVQLASYRELCRKCAHNDPDVVAKKNTPETREKNRIASLGKKHTDETKEKCRNAKLGDKNPMKDPTTRDIHKKTCNTQEWIVAHSGKNSSLYNQEIDAFIKEHQNKHLCACGCGGYIKIERRYYYAGIPKYIYNHHSKLENNTNWKGGISFDPYCIKFNAMMKQKIRDLYDNCDFISGLPAHVCNSYRKLDVHHVDYNKMQGCDDVKWILIPLSRSNNAIVNFNRFFWNRLFTYSLQYDKTYYKKTDKEFNLFEVLL